MPTVLVVDDSEFDRKMVDQVLKEDPTLTAEFVENGVAALERLKRAGIDIVVTDLQMPEVNGLQLVTTIRVDHPQVPVVLMTAHGSEGIAIAALEQGAASYVPKSQLRERLLETIQDLLTFTNADRAYQELVSGFNSTQFDLTLESKPDLIDPLVDYVVQIVGGMGCCDATGAFQIGNALREAILNAIFRGNLEIMPQEFEDQREQMLQGIHVNLVEQRLAQPPYAGRKLHVDVKVTRDEARFKIRHEGDGIDVKSLEYTNEPSAFLDDAASRGVVLMRTFMDEVTFDESGKEVTLVKRRSE